MKTLTILLLAVPIAAFAQDAAKPVSIGGFYQRRARRLLPALALMLVTVTATVSLLQPSQRAGLRPALLGAVTYTSNWWQALAKQSYFSLYGQPPVFQHLWSLAVEEQFYLLWPLLMRRFRSFAALAIAVIVVILAARYGAVAMATANRHDADALRVWNAVINYFYFTRIECMAIGGLFAWMVFRKQRAMLAFVHHPLVQIATYALIAYVLLTSARKPIFSYGWYAVLFGILIVNVSTNRRSLLRFPSRPFDFLGNISFSIYMFHEVAIQLTLAVLGERVSSALLYAASLSLTIAIASAAYLWFERPFLRLKSQFAIVRSTPGMEMAV